MTTRRTSTQSPAAHISPTARSWAFQPSEPAAASREQRDRAAAEFYSRYVAQLRHEALPDSLEQPRTR